MADNLVQKVKGRPDDIIAGKVIYVPGKAIIYHQVQKLQLLDFFLPAGNNLVKYLHRSDKIIQERHGQLGAAHGNANPRNLTDDPADFLGFFRLTVIHCPQIMQQAVVVGYAVPDIAHGIKIVRVDMLLVVFAVIKIVQQYRVPSASQSLLPAMAVF